MTPPRLAKKPAELLRERLTFPRGQVAQSVEQRTENPRVDGSIPPLPTFPLSFIPTLPSATNVAAQTRRESGKTASMPRGGTTPGPQRPFDVKWVVGSMAVFIAAEILFGVLLANVLAGPVTSMSLRFMLQGVLNLLGFFVGGVLIGLISPGLRIREPAMGAFLCVVLMMGLTLFTPYSFIRFSMTKMLIGGAVAFWLALVGARFGERLAGNRMSGV